MKYLIFSDSHGYIEDMVQLIQSQSYDIIIHLGDIYSDVSKIRSICSNHTICAVTGNNDWYNHQLPSELILKSGDFNILLCHGHTYHVKQTLLPLATAAIKKECAVALFGHTHSPVIKTYHHVLLINPGSITFTGTYCVADIGDRIHVEIIHKKTHKIQQELTL